MALSPIEYTPNPLIPSDEEGKDRYLAEELDKIAYTLANMPSAETDESLAESLLHLPAATAVVASNLAALEDVVAALPGGHDPVTVTDSDDMDFTLSGQNVTGVLTDSIHSQLALGVTASRPGHSHKASDIADFEEALANSPTIANAIQEAELLALMGARPYQKPEDDLTPSLLHLPAVTSRLSKDLDALEVTVAGLGGGHAPVTVTDSGEINFTLIGQDITASLDDSVKTSLEIANASVSLFHLPAFTNELKKDLDALTAVVGALPGGHDPVSVLDSAEIDFTLSGQQVTASLRDNSISATKLDTSVNDSLNLANTASRPGHSHPAKSISGLGTLATQNGTFSGTSSGTNTGDQTITLTGDVTGSGTGSFAATIGNGKVTLAKQANVATASVFYRKTAGTGVPEVQPLSTLKTDLGLTGTNSGDQTSIAGISGTKAQFNTAVTDGNFMYIGDAPTAHTHTASAITDFTTAVNTNVNVAANTAARHSAVTKLDTPEIAITLSGQQVSASLRDSSVASARLTPAVQTSLGLADTAVQPQDLASKSNVGHVHAVDELVGFEDIISTVESKASLGHLHTTNEIAGFEEAVTNIASSVASGITEEDLQRGLATRASAFHVHGIDQTLGLGDALAAKANRGHVHTPDEVGGHLPLSTVNTPEILLGVTAQDQILSAYLRDNTIAEVRLTDSVNTALALGLSSARIGHTHPETETVFPSLLHLPAQTRSIAQDHALLVAEVATLREEMSYLHGVLSQVNALKQRINEVELLCL